MTPAARRLPILAALVLAAAVAALALGGPRASGAGAPPTASGFDFVKFPQPAPLCAGVGLRQSPYFTRGDCGFGEVTLGGVPDTADVKAKLTGADGSTLATVDATNSDPGVWQYDITPESGWPAAPVTIRGNADGVAPPGTGTF